MLVGLDLLTHNWTLKLAALVLAFLFWSIQQAEEPQRVSVNGVPVEVRLRDPDWTLAAPPAPPRATVTFIGPIRELPQLAGQRPRIIIPVRDVTDSVEVRVLRPEWVRVRGDLESTRAVDVRPSTVRLFFERLTTRLVPLAVRTRGTPAPGIERTGPVRIEPPAVRVSGPIRRLERLDSLELRTISLAGASDTLSAEVAIDTTGLGELIISPRQVEVTVPLADLTPADTATIAELLFGPTPY